MRISWRLWRRRRRRRRACSCILGEIKDLEVTWTGRKKKSYNVSVPPTNCNFLHLHSSSENGPSCKLQHVRQGRLRIFWKGYLPSTIQNSSWNQAKRTWLFVKHELCCSNTLTSTITPFLSYGSQLLRSICHINICNFSKLHSLFIWPRHQSSLMIRGLRRWTLLPIPETERQAPATAII